MNATEFVDGSVAAAPGDEDAPTLDQALARLLDKLSRRPDFPSLGDALGGVRRVARSEKARLQNLSEALLKDVGLAHRVMRLANAAHYRSAGGGQITTLSRAIAVMGFTEIGQLAVASRLIDQIRDKRHGMALREEFLRALLAGTLAHALHPADEEEAYLVALFQNLGRLVLYLHEPDEALAARATVARSLWPRREAEDLATRRQVGVGSARLGLAVAERWGWPETLRRALRPDPLPRHRPTQRSEQLRVIACLANDLSDLLIYADPRCWDAACDQLQAQCGEAAGHDARSMRAAMARARNQLEALAELLELPLSQLAAWQGAPELVQQSAPEAAGHPPAGGETAAATQAPDEAGPTDVVPGPAAPAPAVGQATRHLTLSDGVQDVVQALADDQPAEQIQAMVVETLLRGLGAQRAVLCLRRGSQGDLVGEVGLGHAVPSQHQHFLVPPRDPHDLFSLLCAKGADTLISDADDPAIAARLPRWWRVHARARSFLVLPMMQGREPVGMLYCDAPQPGGLVLDEAAMKLARTLRSQALIAWRQGS